MKTADFNPDKMLDVLREKATQPNPRSQTIKEILATEPFQKVITELKEARYSIPEIAELISKQDGVSHSRNTITFYLREIQRDARGEDNAKAPRKPKASKPRVEEKAEAKSSDKPAEKPTSKTDNAGKTLTTKPNMGGAFNSDEL